MAWKLKKWLYGDNHVIVIPDINFSGSFKMAVKKLYKQWKEHYLFFWENVVNWIKKNRRVVWQTGYTCSVTCMLSLKIYFNILKYILIVKMSTYGNTANENLANFACLILLNMIKNRINCYWAGFLNSKQQKLEYMIITHWWKVIYFLFARLSLLAKYIMNYWIYLNKTLQVSTGSITN